MNWTPSSQKYPAFARTNDLNSELVSVPYHGVPQVPLINAGAVLHGRGDLCVSRETTRFRARNALTVLNYQKRQTTSSWGIYPSAQQLR